MRPPLDVSQLFNIAFCSILSKFGPTTDGYQLNDCQLGQGFGLFTLPWQAMGPLS